MAAERARVYWDGTLMDGGDWRCLGCRRRVEQHPAHNCPYALDSLQNEVARSVERGIGP